jgi:hypothetical protein
VQRHILGFDDNPRIADHARRKRHGDDGLQVDISVTVYRDLDFAHDHVDAFLLRVYLERAPRRIVGDTADRTKQIRPQSQSRCHWTDGQTELRNDFYDERDGRLERTHIDNERNRINARERERNRLFEK